MLHCYADGHEINTIPLNLGNKSSVSFKKASKTSKKCAKTLKSER